MAYITLADLKEDLGIAEETDDYVLEQKIDAAQAAIDLYTSRTFEAASSVKYYTWDDVDGLILWLDDDLVSLTSVANGDSSSTAISTNDITLLPRNEGPPYDRLRLDDTSTSSWEVDTDYWIAVTGTWGWAAAAPEPIKQACLRMAAHMYRLRDADVFDVVSFPGEGIIQVRGELPADVRVLLDPYVKRI
jgi:uncharacterized phiE125 gp8 family phage protein